MRAILLLGLVLGVGPLSCAAADLTADQVREVLAKADRDRPADLAGKNLSDLDLSNIDFKGAISQAPICLRLVSSHQIWQAQS